MARYTDEYRASAVAMLQMQGYPDKPGALMAVAQYLNIPHITLSRWYRAKQNPPPNKTVHIKKEQLITLIKREIHAALREMDNARPDADYRALATAIGILTDKMQLLEGEPTARIDNQDWHDRAIEDIKAGRVTYQALAEAFDENLAARLFAEAGITISPE